VYCSIIHNGQNAPTIAEWILKMWYLCKIEFYSAMKKNKMSFAGQQMELRNIILNKVSQVQKYKGSMFSLICER
jgi:hypothetical protein